MNKKYSANLLTILAVSIVSLILTAGCSKEDKWTPEPPSKQYVVSSSEGYWNPNFEDNKLNVSANTSHLSLPIALIGGEGSYFNLDHPYPEYKEPTSGNEAYWAAIYADAEVAYMSWRNAPVSHKDNGEMWNDIRIAHSSENVWEGDGFKVERIWNGDKYTLEVTIPENPDSKAREIQFGWGSHDENDYYMAFSTFLITQEGNKIFKSRYKGQNFISKYHETSEGEIIYEDEATARMIASLHNKEGIETVAYGDIVYFFDTEDLERHSALKKLCNNISGKLPEHAEAVITRATPLEVFSHYQSGALGYAILYDDTDFKDTYIFNNLSGNLYAEWIEKDLTDRGMNDKVSSLAVGYYGSDPDATCVLTVWEDDNLNASDKDRTKHRMNFIATRDNPQVMWSNLKSIPCIGSSKSWNDRISSLSHHFGNYGINMKDY